MCIEEMLKLTEPRNMGAYGTKGLDNKLIRSGEVIRMDIAGLGLPVLLFQNEDGNILNGLRNYRIEITGTDSIQAVLTPTKKAPHYGFEIKGDCKIDNFKPFRMVDFQDEGIYSFLEKPKSDFEYLQVQDRELNNNTVELENYVDEDLVFDIDPIDRIIDSEDESIIDDEKNIQKAIQHLDYINKYETSLCFNNDKIKCQFEKDGVDVNEQREKFIDSFIENKITVLNSSAGTGKTKVLNSLITYLRNQQHKVLVMSYSGKASSLLQDGHTIHKSLGADYNGNFAKYEENVLKVCGKWIPDVIIIDETSFLTPNLLLSLTKSIPNKSKIIFAGDSKQLKMSNYDILLKLGSHFGCVKFSRNFRTTNQIIKTLSDSVLNNKLKLKYPLLSNLKKQIIGLYNEKYQFLTNTRKSREEFILLIQEHKLSTQTPIYTNYTYSFFKNDKIVVKQNLYRYGLMNGDLCIIIDYEDNYFTLWHNELKEIKIHRSEFDNEKFESADCMTIHKSQGSEYSNVAIFIAKTKKYKMDEKSLLYTAVTRAKDNATILNDS